MRGEGMRVLIWSIEGQASAEAVALLGRMRPGWHVHVCESFDSCEHKAGAEHWDVLVSDFGGSPRQIVAPDGPGGPVTVAWCSPDDGASLAQALEGGVSFHVVRAPGWQDYFLPVISQAASQAQRRAHGVDDAACIGTLRTVQQQLLWATHAPTIIATEAGHIVQFNQAAEELTGLAAESVIGGRVQDLVICADAPTDLVTKAREATDRGDRRFTCRGQIRHREGHGVMCTVSAALASPPAGEGALLVLVMRLESARPALAAPLPPLASGLMAQAAEACPMPIAVIGADGTILRANGAFVRALGAAALQDVAGGSIYAILQTPEEMAQIVHDLRRGTGTSIVNTALITRDGVAKPCRVTLTAAKATCPDMPIITISLTTQTDATTSPGGPMTIVPRRSTIPEPLARAVRDAADMPTLVSAVLDAAQHVADFHSAIAVVWDAACGDTEWEARSIPQDCAADIAHAIVADASEQAWQPEDAWPILVTHVVDMSGGPARDRLRDMYLRRGVESVCRIAVAPKGDATFVLDLASAAPLDAGKARRDIDELALQIVSAVSHVLGARRTSRAARVQTQLLQVPEGLGVNAPVDDALQLIAQCAIEVAGGRACTIRLLDEDSRQLGEPFSASTQQPQEAADSAAWCGETAWQAIHAADVVSAGPDEETGDGPCVAVPMLVDGRAVGVVTVERAKGHGFRGDELGSLKLLAAQAASAVQNARLHEVAKRRSEHMELVAAQAWQEEARATALFEVATAVTEKTDLQEILADVTRSACMDIGFERARIYLANPEHRTLEGRLEARAGRDPVPLEGQSVPLTRGGGSQLAEAVLGDAPYVIDRAPPGPDGGAHERLLVPLATQGLLVGLIVADNPETGSPVSPQRTRLLHSLAGLASVAIERARLEKLRGTLISSVSHELRAPLASIRAYNELVLEGDAGAVNDEQRTYLTRVDHACMRLERVIGDLMNLSKLRTGEVTIAKAPVDLANLVRGVLDTLAPKAGATGIDLQFHEADNAPLTMTDPGRLEQVLTNLVDNAIKFNQAGGYVCVTLAVDGSRALLSVADDGPGIDAPYQQVVFEEFQHGTDDHSRAKEGAGLGLAIAKRVIEVLGGGLRLESELGHGSTFHVELPLEPMPGEQADDPGDCRSRLRLEMGETYERPDNTDHRR